MQMTMHEILEKVRKAKNKALKIKILKENDTPELRSLLKSSFDPNIEWLLPEGPVPYDQKDFKLGDGSHKFLETEIPTLYHFVKGGNDGMKSVKREQTYIQLLESLHETEAKLLIAAKDKLLGKTYNISDQVVKEAFDWNKSYTRN